MIQDFILRGAPPWSLNPWLTEKLRSFWHAIEMKPTFRFVAVALALGATVQADCPDFTTYSQVNWITLRRLSMPNTTFTSRARKAMPPQVHSLCRLWGLSLHVELSIVHPLKYGSPLSSRLVVFDGSDILESYWRHEITGETFFVLFLVFRIDHELYNLSLVAQGSRPCPLVRKYLS